MPKKRNLPSSDAVPLPVQLPTPRKRPNQSRSRALVDAVAQACLHILDEEGDEALTVARIAEVSGAAVGSITNTFPTKTPSWPCCTSACWTRSLSSCC